MDKQKNVCMDASFLIFNLSYEVLGITSVQLYPYRNGLRVKHIRISVKILQRSYFGISSEASDGCARVLCLHIDGMHTPIPSSQRIGLAQLVCKYWSLAADMNNKCTRVLLMLSHDDVNKQTLTTACGTQQYRRTIIDVLEHEACWRIMYAGDSSDLKINTHTFFVWSDF